MISTKLITIKEGLVDELADIQKEKEHLEGVSLNIKKKLAELIGKIMLLVIEFFLTNCITGIKFNKFFYLNPMFYKNAWKMVMLIVDLIKAFTEEEDEIELKTIYNNQLN